MTYDIVPRAMMRFARTASRLAVALVVTCLLSAAPAVSQQPTHTFRIGDGAFLLDGKPIQLISGEMHYARIPREYWRHRLRMAKAMGLNTIATYVFWNYHEVRPGVFDFHTGNRDLAAFLRTAQEEGLWVILRPGPYVCAEWDLGGIPSYLLKESDLQVRSRDPRFLAAERRYITALAAQVRPLLVTHGGPVLMVQVENEYGSYGADSTYLAKTRQMFVDAGFDVPLFTADGDWLFAKGAIPGLLPAANGEMNYDTLVARVNRFHGGEGPYMVSEFYPGWLAHWAEPFPTTPVDSFLPAYEALLRRGASVNLYMFHGGTNFGFTSGANYTKKVPIQPDMTSYDYDAPLSEAGWPTPKYYALRNVIRRHVSYSIPDVPDSLPVISIPPVTLAPTENLFDLIARTTATHSNEPLSFEELGQASGYVLYRHQFDSAVHGVLDVEGLRDYGLVFVNGHRVAILNRQTRTFSTPVTVPAGGRLDILVENMGRINYGAEMVNNRKGIISPVQLNGVTLTGWAMYGLPFDSVPPVVRRGSPAAAGVPEVYRGTVTLSRTGDTFLDMRGWGKGIVFVNGHNLGRYWRVGPQQTLYLPGAWLRRGRNEIVVFAQWNDAERPVIAGLERPILTELQPASDTAVRTTQTRNVVLIVSDGLRWQDVFGGADTAMINRKDGGVDDTASLRKEFWRATPAAARATLMPFIWHVIAEQGQLYGNADVGSSVQVTNGFKFSYPGYNEMLSGHPDPRIDSNDAGPNPNLTVFEWLNGLPAYHGRVAAFGTWNEFDDIFNEQRSGIPVRAGWEIPFDSATTPQQLLLDSLYSGTMQLWSDLAYDSFMQETVLEYVRTHHPRVLFVGYGETDEWAHLRRYDQYLHSTHRVDEFVAELWRTMQQIPQYRDSTTFIITADHGRGGGPHDWTDHGRDVAGAEHIWIAVLGPDTPPLGERANVAEVTQSQIAATLAALLGQDYRSAVPDAAPPMQSVIRTRARVSSQPASRQH